MSFRLVTVLSSLAAPCSDIGFRRPSHNIRVSSWWPAGIALHASMRGHRRFGVAILRENLAELKRGYEPIIPSQVGLEPIEATVFLSLLNKARVSFVPSYRDGSAKSPFG